MRHTTVLYHRAVHATFYTIFTSVDVFFLWLFVQLRFPHECVTNRFAYDYSMKFMQPYNWWVENYLKILWFLILFSQSCTTYFAGKILQSYHLSSRESFVGSSSPVAQGIDMGIWQWLSGRKESSMTKRGYKSAWQKTHWYWNVTIKRMKNNALYTYIYLYKCMYK